MIILLWFLLIYIFLILYIVHKQDILYPSIVLCLVFIFFIACTFYVWDEWNMKDYSFKAAGLILLSVLEFAFIGVLIERIIFCGKKCVTGVSTQPSNCIHEIHINNGYVIFSCIVCAFSLLWFLREVVRISGGGNNWISIMASYRYRTHKQVLDLDERMPFLLRQLSKFILTQGYLCCGVLANNIIARKFRRGDFGLLILILIACLQAIFNSVRMDIVKYMACFAISIYILWHRKNGWNRNLSSKFAQRAALALVLFIGAFYLFKGVVGRTTDKSFLYYTAEYTGGPIKLLDMYFQEPSSISKIWGGETFYSINEFVMRFTKGGITFRKALEFRYINGKSIGNVYTAIRRYYNDFGLAGVIILVGLSSIFINYMYCKIKYSKRRDADFRVFLYAMLFFVVPLFAYEEYLFSVVFSVNYLARILILYVLYIVLVKKHIGLQNRKIIIGRINR